MEPHFHLPQYCPSSSFVSRCVVSSPKEQTLTDIEELRLGDGVFASLY